MFNSIMRMTIRFVFFLVKLHAQLFSWVVNKARVWYIEHDACILKPLENSVYIFINKIFKKLIYVSKTNKHIWGWHPPSPLRTAYCLILTLRTAYCLILTLRTAYRLTKENKEKMIVLNWYFKYHMLIIFSVRHIFTFMLSSACLRTKITTH